MFTFTASVNFDTFTNQKTTGGTRLSSIRNLIRIQSENLTEINRIRLIPNLSI